MVCGCQRAAGPPEAFAAESVGQRVGGVADQGFDQLRERVHAGIGGYLGRQGVGEGRVNHGQSREKKQASQTGLHRVLGHAQHGVSGGLGSCARRGGHGDHGHAGTVEWPPSSDDFQVVQHLSGVREHRRHGLPGIDHAAAADGDHQVAAMPSSPPCGLVDQVGCGLAFDVEAVTFNTRLFQA